MPKKYPKRKRQYRRRYRTRKRRAASGVIGATGTRPFANSKIATLNYTDRITMTSNLAAIDTYLFQANSAYDVDYQVGGHQPYSFDTYMGLYSRYEVLDTQITVTVSNRDNNYAYLFALSAQSGVSVPTDINNYMEGPNSKWALIGPENSGHGKAKLSLKLKNAKFLGLKPNDDALQGTSGTNPDQMSFFHLAAQTPQSQNPSALDVIVDIKQRIKFSHPLKLAQS